MTWDPLDSAGPCDDNFGCTGSRSRTKDHLVLRISRVQKAGLDVHDVSFAAEVQYGEKSFWWNLLSSPQRLESTLA